MNRFCQEIPNIPLIYTQYGKLSPGNNSTIQPIPVNEGSFTNDQILKVITGDRGYSFQTDEHPIEMVEAGCGVGRAFCITATKWIAGVKIRLQ